MKIINTVVNETRCKEQRTVTESKSYRYVRLKKEDHITAKQKGL